MVVSNGLDRPVYVEDLHTACSAGVLERQTQDGWVALPDCGAERLATVLSIEPAEGLTITVDPQAMEATDVPLSPGTYRMSVGWRNQPEPQGVVEGWSRSEPFQVH